MQKIAENIYGIFTRGGFLNYYVIANGDTLTVVDIGMSAEDVDRLELELGEHGWSIDNVRYVLITHAHYDHVGGLAELQRRANVHTCAHRLEAPVIRGEQAAAYANPAELGFFNRLMLNSVPRSSATPARVDRELTDGDTLDDILPGLLAVHLPGHTYGNMGYWLPESRAFIAGDTVMRFLGLRMPFRMASPDWEEAKLSVKKLAEMDVDILCMTHGKPIIGGAGAQIRALADKLMI